MRKGIITLSQVFFGERWIYEHPTALRAKFMILRFNFSAVNSTPGRLEESFEEHCTGRLVEFADKYEHLFQPGFRQELMSRTTASTRLDYINSTASRLRLRIYLIIDEYDNFTNTILSTFGKDEYRKATHGEGFFRYFFNVLKFLTSGNGMALERMFITGVSPITLDDVTSGFNIGTNITTSPLFNALVGFTETELRTMLEYYRDRGALTMGVEEMIADMKPWYDNYHFSEECLNESMYNSDMTLYYMNSCLKLGKKPREMVDTNIRTDYNKLRHLIRIDHELDANFSVIREIVENGRTSGTISSAFSVEKMVDENNFKSLLYYFGLLSIRGVEEGETVLAIPNNTVREQFYNYLTEAYADENIFSLNISTLGKLAKEMAYRADWQPLFTYIATELEKQSRIREFIDGEAHVKGFLLAYLNMTNFYQLMPEYELGKGYADFYFRPNPQISDIRYAYLMEVKYLKRDEPESRIATLKEEARTQLLKYASDEIVAQTIGGAQLKLITIVFRGWEIVGMEETDKLFNEKRDS